MDRFLSKKAKMIENEDLIEESILEDVNKTTTDSDCGKKCDSSKRKFRNEWLTKFIWLKENKGQSFCVPCDKTLSNHFGVLKKHEESPFHIKTTEQKKKQIKIEEFIDKKNLSIHKQVRHAELTLVMFCISHNLPFMLMDFLPNLLKECCPDSQIAKLIECGRTKATDLTETLANKAREKVIATLQKQKFSLIVDETTDLSTKKSLVLVVRYVDRLSKVVNDKFLALLEMTESDSESIYQAIKGCLEKYKIPLKNLIGLATDGANVLAGEISGLQAKLKQNVDLFYIKCTCHFLHLCSSYACKKLPLQVEKLCRNIYNFFAYSPKRVNNFKEFQIYCEVKPHKILGISQTRWLALENVINRLLEQWDALKLYFVSCYLEVNGIHAADLAHDMDNTENKIYCQFLAYILKIINNLNKEFQSEKVRLPYLYGQMETNFKLIAINFMKQSYVKNLNNISYINLYDDKQYLSIHDTFIGVKSEELIRNCSLSESEIVNIKKTIRYFYIELLDQILRRFDFSNTEISELSIITPQKFFSDPEASILTLVSKFSHLIECDPEIIVTQWKLLQLSNFKITNKQDINEFWSEISMLKNGLDEYCFKELTDFIFNLITLPHSSAAAERKFSELSLIKTKLRNRLEFKTINNIMSAKEMCNSKSNNKYVWSAKDFFS